MHCWTAGWGGSTRPGGACRRFSKRSRTRPYRATFTGSSGEQLENHAATRDLAYAIYEAAVNRTDDDGYNRLQFNTGPASRLIKLYERDHRIDDLRRLLVNSSRFEQSSNSNVIYPDGYLSQLKMQALATAADKLLELGFAADAVLLYNQAIALSAELAPDAPRYFVNNDGSGGYFNQGLTRAMEAVTPADLAASLSRLLQAEEDPKAGAAGTSSKPTAGPRSAGGAGKSKKDEPFLDMMMLAHPRTLDKARVRSLFAEAVTAAPGKGAGRGERARCALGGARSRAQEAPRRPGTGGLRGAAGDREQRPGAEGSGGFPACQTGGADAARNAGKQRPSQCAAACGGRAADSAVAGGPGMLETRKTASTPSWCGCSKTARSRQRAARPTTPSIWR